MSLLPDLGSVFDASSGVFLAGLAGLLLLVRPRRRSTVMLAVFAASLGLSSLLGNVASPDDPLAVPLGAGSSLFSYTASAALVLLALWYPRPVARREIGLLALPAAVGLAVGALYLAWRYSQFLATGSLAAFSLQPAFWFALTLFAVRFGAEPEDSPHRRQLALISGALLLFPGIVAGIYGRTFDLPDMGKLPASLLLAALWLRNTSASARPGSRWARDLALLTLALLAVGLAANGSVEDPISGGPLGLARILMVLGLAYAILRQQLLGLDLTVKWTVKQSTVAAAFIGVFFVASETASSFLATEGGLGTYLGIAAAGLLVFALAPLQRAAEKVASAAMPGVRPPAEMSRDERSATYRRMLQLAWQDGALDKSERAMLRGLREQLGLTAEEAERLEAEVTRA